MLNITNNKIASFKAEFKEFRGFSCLFDKPSEEDSTKLYTSLYNAFHEIDIRSMANTYLFSPLPLHSYHVTVWDGVNDNNLESIDSSHREYFQKFLNCLTHFPQLDEPFAGFIRSSPLITDNDWGIQFKFKKLSIWKEGLVLVAQLEPGDDYSMQKLIRLKEERKTLYDKFEEELGISMYRNYTPHVSLGYFPNKECAMKALPEISGWNSTFAKNLERIMIRFKSISLYCFNDMTNYFKARPGIRYTKGTSSDLKIIERLMHMHDFYRTIPGFYGHSIHSQANRKKTINEKTIEKMRAGVYTPNQESMKKHQESYYTSLIIRLSESEGDQVFLPVRVAYNEITSLIKSYYPTTQVEVYLDSAHITIRSILNNQKQSYSQLEKYRDVLYPNIKKWLHRFSTDTVLYLKGFHISLSSFKGLSIGIKLFSNTSLIQTLRGTSGVTLYNALDLGILKPEDLWEESRSAEWHTKLTHTTGMRVRDSNFLLPWAPNPIPEREKEFIDSFEALIEKYESIVFGKISNIQLSNIAIRNGKSDKLTISPDFGIEVPFN